MPLTDPVPSSSFDVLERNIQDTDKFVNQETGTFTNRVGKEIKPIPVIDAEANAVVISLGWHQVGLFADGFTYLLQNDIAKDAAGDWYRWNGTIPSGGYVVAAGTLPSSDVNFVKIDYKSHAELTDRNPADGSAHNADDVAKNGGGSIQSFIDSTEQSLLMIDSTSVKSCAEWADLLVRGTNPVIAGVGDSTMFSATVGALGIQDPNNVMASLKKALSLLYNTYNLTPLNLGISGSTLDGMINGTDGSGSTFEQKLNGGVLTNVDIIPCNHGINDSQLDLGVGRYRENLYKFVYLCRKYNSTPILITPNPNPIYDIIDEVKSKRLYEYVKMMRYVARQTNCELVDQYDFFTKTSKTIPMIEIVPDGAHLSSRAYLQAGFNLAIPLISARTITNHGDIAGLANVTWYDNGILGRTLYKSGDLSRETRCGSTLSFDRTAGIVGLSYPVIMDSPLECVSIIGLQWTSGANMFLDINTIGAATQFYQAREYGDKTVLDWDAENKIHYPFWAGLNVFSFYFDNSSPSVGEGFAFSGVYVPESKFSVKNTDLSDYTTYPSVGIFDTVIADVDFSEGNGLTLSDKSGSPCLKVISLSGKIYLQTWANGSAVLSQELSASTIADGNYPVRLSISYESITVKVSGIGTTIALNEPVTDMRVSTPWLSYCVRPSVIF